MIAAILEFIKSLNLGEKLSPRKNVEIIWFYIFLPCLIAYFVLLTGFINSKPAIGSIETIHSSFNSLIYSNKNMEIIASDLTFTEGPLWVEDEASSSSYLMFSDIRLNRIYKWEDGKGLFTVGKTIYVEKSGCKTNETYCNQLVQGGSNGLLRRSKTSLDLIVCQHGERAVSLIAENGLRHPIATHYKGLRLNSPNDLIYSPEGHIYFTDPKFGLFDKNGKVVGKELQHSGVYMIRNEHLLQSLTAQIATPMVKLLDASLAWPNGLAFSPDYSKLYVSNADKKNAYWKVFDVMDDGSLSDGKVFFNATELYAEECALQAAAMNQSTCDMRNIGAPDGLKVDIYGNVFATGPGGILVLNPAGQLIGRFRLDRPVSNLVFGTDGRLYITAKDIVARVWIKTKPTRIVSV